MHFFSFPYLYQLFVIVTHSLQCLQTSHQGSKIYVILKKGILNPYWWHFTICIQNTSGFNLKKLMMLERKERWVKKILNWKNWIWKLNLSRRKKAENTLLKLGINNMEECPLSMPSSIICFECAFKSRKILSIVQHWFHIFVIFWTLLGWNVEEIDAWYRQKHRAILLLWHSENRLCANIFCINVVYSYLMNGRKTNWHCCLD